MAPSSLSTVLGELRLLLLVLGCTIIKLLQQGVAVLSWRGYQTASPPSRQWQQEQGAGVIWLGRLKAQSTGTAAQTEHNYTAEQHANCHLDGSAWNMGVSALLASIHTEPHSFRLAKMLCSLVDQQLYSQAGAVSLCTFLLGWLGLWPNGMSLAVVGMLSCFKYIVA
jgi:hypothetical protein